MSSERSRNEIVERMLGHPRPLPQNPVDEQVVFWRTFRSPDKAVAFSHAIQLGKGQDIVGGRTRDSIGELYWIGVHVEDLAKWGNTKAIQLSDPFDADDPEAQGRPFEHHR
jgi:hypothetical protein